MNENKPLNPIIRLISPIQQFVSMQALSGLVLLSCSVLALILANSPLADQYEHFWHTEIGFQIGSLKISHSLHHWINDGLMAIFFFVIGLEMKRELLLGELSSKEKVILPVIAAIGGAVVPALIYLIFNVNQAGMDGWGIVMATDIAFVLGIITLLGNRVPASIKIFVLAFAIIDDLIAIVIIAAFYTAEINLTALYAGLGVLAFAFIFKYAGFYHTLVFLLMGIISWFFFLESGIHPTIAGVAMAITVPAMRKIGKKEYPEQVSELINQYQQINPNEKPGKEQQQVIISKIEELSVSTESPLYRLEHLLHPLTSFIIMPVFALANAGISLDSSMIGSMAHPISLGIIMALVLGKPIGIFFSIWATVKSKWAILPSGANWMHIFGMACLGGMGFTLSLFISVLAFKDPVLLGYAKIGVLAGSLVSIIAGVGIFLLNRKNGNGEINES